MQNQSDYQELFALTRDLISFKSITPLDAGCLDYIQNYLSLLGFNFTRLDRNKTTNLIASLGDTNTQAIVAFAGHVDVVPTGDSAKWRHNPFELVEENDYLYGRGISDMKGALAAFLYACRKLVSANQQQKKAIMLLLTSDEEGSGVDGTPVMVEYLKQKNIVLDYCIVGEPTSITQIGDVVKIGRRGSLNCHIEVLGKQGHVAYPHLAQNPIHEFAPVLNELVSSTWDNGNEYFPPTQLQITNINAGLGVDNVTPYNLHVKLNLRYNNLHTSDTLQQQITAILNKHHFKYNIRWQNSAKPFLSSNGRLCQIITAAVKQHSGVNTKLSTDGGTSDARFLIEVSKEILELGLTNKYIHQVDERIHKDELVTLSNVYYSYLQAGIE